jgi:hypothetical protein
MRARHGLVWLIIGVKPARDNSVQLVVPILGSVANVCLDNCYAITTFDAV